MNDTHLEQDVISVFVPEKCLAQTGLDGIQQKSGRVM